MVFKTGELFEFNTKISASKQGYFALSLKSYITNGFCFITIVAGQIIEINLREVF